MFKKRLLNKFIGFLMCCVFVFCNVLIPTQSMAYDGIRDDPDGCNIPEDTTKNRANNPCYIVNFNNDTNKCEVGNLKFSAMLPLNRDIEWELFPLPGNSYCLAFVTLHVFALFAISKLGSIACAGSGISAAIQAGNIIPGIGPQSLVTQLLFGANCFTAGVQCAASNVVACGSVAPCCAAAAAYTATLAAAVVELAIIFAIADSFFKETNVCGWKWRGWEKEVITDTEENKRESKWQASKGPYRKCIENIFSPGLHKTDKTFGQVAAYKSCGDPAFGNTRSNENKSYREYIYGGMEFEDNGSNACTNPWSGEERKKVLGYESQNQRYYFSGAGEGSVPNFACYRFLRKTDSDPTGELSRSAYDCCVSRSQEVLCIERPQSACVGSLCDNIKYKFCEANSKCDIEGVTFETFYGKLNSNYLCAKSYSVCPYNQTVAGGTESAKYDEDPLYSDVKLNFCQHLNHCWKLPLQPTIRTSEFSGNFIASACYDMKGDSQNSHEYNAGQLPISTRHFTAPFVQCFKETMENVFLNRAGHDICTNSSYNSLPKCGGASNILYAEGTYLPDDQSFFKKIQNNYRMVLKMILTFSIIMLGISTLLAVPKLHLEKKVIMTFILKLSLVMYFALGDAWQLSFANAVLNISSIMSDITFRPNLYNGDYTKLDGCQFPRYNSESTTQRDYTKQSYPAGKEYLRIWDVLDCKIIKALGFGGEVSVPNIFLIIIAGFFSSALGVVIFVATFIFGFILISIAIRAMHIFLISTSAIVIFLFISPITITMVMFERTKKVFESWWKQLLGYSLQPMILFIYISIFLTAMDSILIGSATYSGAKVKISPDKRYVGMTSVNDQEAIDNYGFISEKIVNCNIGNASWDSIICIFNLTKFGKLSGFDTIGIGIPTITNITKEKLETITKSALIMFIFLNFIDTMTMFASKLVGGAEIKSDWDVKTTRMLKGAHNLIRGIQKRGMRGMLKHGSSIARLGSNLMKGGAELANASKNISNARKQGDNNPSDSGGDDGDSGDKKQGEGPEDSASPPSPGSSGGGEAGGKAGPSADHQATDSKSSGADSAGASAGGDHVARGDSKGSGADGAVASAGGDHQARDSKSAGADSAGASAGGDHVARGDSKGGTNSGSTSPASTDGSSAKGDGDLKSDGQSSSTDDSIKEGSGDGAGGELPLPKDGSSNEEVKDGVAKPDARSKESGAGLGDDHAKRSDEDSDGESSSQDDDPEKSFDDPKGSADEADKKDNPPSDEFADKSNSPQPSAQGDHASSAINPTASKDDKKEDELSDQKPKGDQDNDGYEGDNEDDQSSQDESFEGGDDDKGEAGADIKGDDQSKAKLLKPSKGKANSRVNGKMKGSKKPKTGGPSSAGGGSSGGGSSSGPAQGGDSLAGSAQIQGAGSSSGDSNIPIRDRSAGETAGISTEISKGESSRNSENTSNLARKESGSQAIGLASQSDVKIGIDNLSDGIKIGVGGDIIGGRLGEGLGIKSSGDALEKIIANKTDKDDSSMLSSRKSPRGEGSSGKGKMSGDQAKALSDMLKNQSQDQVSGISQGAQSSGFKGQSSLNGSSQFPSLSGQSLARDVPSIIPEAGSSGGIGSQISASKPAFPSLPGVGQKSTSSSSSTSPQQNTQQLIGNKKISDQVKRVVNARGAGSSSSGSGGSSPLDHLGVLGDFMAKGIDPLSKGISGAIDNLFGIDSSKSQGAQSLRVNSALPSQLKSELLPSKNQTSQSGVLSSASPLDIRNEVSRAIQGRQDPSKNLFSEAQSYRDFSSDSSKSSTASKEKISQTSDGRLSAKVGVRNAWGEDKDPPSIPSESVLDQKVNVESVATPQSTQMRWGESRDPRERKQAVKKNEDMKFQDIEEEEIEIEIEDKDKE